MEISSSSDSEANYVNYQKNLWKKNSKNYRAKKKALLEDNQEYSSIKKDEESNYFEDFSLESKNIDFEENILENSVSSENNEEFETGK